MNLNYRCGAVNIRTPRARVLGNALRSARENHEISLRQFAKQIGIDASMVSRWETGDRPPPVTEVARILGWLTITGDRYHELMELAYKAQHARWLSETPGDQRAQLAAMLDFERTASALTDVSPLLIPGLLQTSAYTRALMTKGGLSPAEASSRAAIRLGRREILTREDPVQLTAFIGEAALRQRIGSRQIMAEQLDHLLHMAGWANVEIRIVPFDSDWHSGLEGSIFMIEAEWQTPVVHLEQHNSGLFLHTESDIAGYRRRIGTVSAEAINVEDSMAVIALAKSAWESA